MYEFPEEEGRPPDTPPPSTESSRKFWSQPELFFTNMDLNRNNLLYIKSNLNGTYCEERNNNGPSSSSKNRNSFHHQDVEEALNSLLWQPYEYQNHNKQKTSSCSSCTSIDSYGLDEDDPPLLASNKDPLHSSVEENTDLNLYNTEMVNNLMATNQYNVGTKSHDPLSSTPATSRLNSQASLLEECMDDGCSGIVINQIGSQLLSDVYKNCDMQLECPVSVATTNILNISTNSTDLTGSNGLNQVTTIFQANAALSTANVVGLPRRASVPIDGTTTIKSPTGNNVLPNHPRNVSEPSTMSNQLRYNNQSNVVPHQQQKNTTSIEQQNLELITNLRSASVPKNLSKTTNISNINVNCYRAVPVNVVSAVPTIQCLNTLNNEEGNNVSNVHIMPLGQFTQNSYPYSTSSVIGTTQVTVHNTHTPTHQTQQISIPPRPTEIVRTRTFTSTEAQTDEISVCPPPLPATVPVELTREQRRKERRERRLQRRMNNHRHHQLIDNSTQSTNNERLPDLLNSHHLPPPYSPLANNVVPPPPPPPNVVIPQIVPPGTLLQTIVPNSGLVPFPPPQVPLVPSGPPPTVAVPVTAPPSGFRFPFPASGFRRGRFNEEPPKGCCGLLTWKPGSLRWFIALIALVAVCCVLVGTALGAMRPAGRDHLTVSLLMIGVGIVLVTVSGVAWRLTSHDSSTCRSMLGLGSTESVDVCARRFVPRLPPSYGRPHHPYAAMMYPEFQYRPPPPSYQASMQEYRLRLLLLDRGNTPQIQASVQNTVSPPPTYRSHAGSLLRAPLSNRRDACQSEYSCPPSYRSQNSIHRPGGGSGGNQSVLHSREQSLSISESNNGESVNVVNILGSNEEDLGLDNITLDSMKMEPESEINPLRMLMLKSGSSSDLEGSKDGNLVTIVQTNDQNPVIVTVSGSSHIDGGHVGSEMEILAHL